MGFQRSPGIHVHRIGAQLPFFYMEDDPLDVDRFSQDRQDPDHILFDLLSKRGRAGFILVHVERRPLFPENSKGGEGEQVGKIIGSGVNNLFDLKARADGSDRGAEHVQVLEYEAHRCPLFLGYDSLGFPHFWEDLREEFPADHTFG